MNRILPIAIYLTAGLVTLAEEKEAAPKRAFLGVHVTSVPAAVRAQTELDDGCGLMIDFIQKDSPAQQAQLKHHDILTQFDDQKLLSPDQFATLIKGALIGQTIQLGILRKGKPLTIPVQLSEAPANAIAFLPNPAANIPHPDMQEFLSKNPTAVQLLAGLMKSTTTDPNGNKTNTAPPHSFRMADEEGSVEIHTTPTGEEATVRDASGQLLFKGKLLAHSPDNTPSPPVLARIDKLRKSIKTLGKSP